MRHLFRGAPYALARAGCADGFETVAFRAEVDKDDVHRGWSIKVRQVLFAPAAASAAFVADPWVSLGEQSRSVVEVVVNRHATPRPSRRQVLHAVASACRYPQFQLYGDPAATLAALEARRGRRLSTRFGSLYGGRAD